MGTGDIESTEKLVYTAANPGPRAPRPHKYNECIYCRSKTPGQDRLRFTTEHIVPEAFGGTLKLYNSVCRTCQEIIGDFETYCIEKTFWGLRAVAGNSTVLPKGRALGILPVVHPPTLEWGQDVRHSGLSLLAVRGELAAPQKLEAIDHSFRESVFEIDIQSYSRFYAKIAHCQVVQTYGLDAFDPFLIPIILGKAANYYSYVGGTQFHPDPREYDEPTDAWGYRCKYDHVDMGDETWIVTYLTLFTKWVMPTYVVIVGAMKDRSSQMLAHRRLGDIARIAESSFVPLAHIPPRVSEVPRTSRHTVKRHGVPLRVRLENEEIVAEPTETFLDWAR